MSVDWSAFPVIELFSLRRTEVRVPIADQTFIGVGDHMEKKLSEKLAAQSALIQLASAGVVRARSAFPTYSPTHFPIYSPLI